MWGEVWSLVGFGVSEYTLVFRRGGGQTAGRAPRGWTVVRPVAAQLPTARRSNATKPGARTDELFVVPICSTLALDHGAYERFLQGSGVLDGALRLLAAVSLRDEETVETARKEIQALVMAAEVQFIVEGMSA